MAALFTAPSRGVPACPAAESADHVLAGDDERLVGVVRHSHESKSQMKCLGLVSRPGFSGTLFWGEDNL